MPELYDFQKEGAQWLTERKVALLADEMGLGKTAQAITACDLLDARRVLVLCPAIARVNWMREWSRFSKRSLSCTVYLKTADARTSSRSDVTICSYDLASGTELSSALSAESWDVCVLDESHYLKNRRAKRTQAVLGRIFGQCTAVWALSGTPAPNNSAELWPLLHAFGVYPQDYWSFVRRYCVFRTTPFGVQITGGRNIPELKRLIAPILLRRRKEAVLTQLPKILFTNVAIEATEIPAAKLINEYWPNYKTFAPERQVSVLQEDLVEQSRVLETLVKDIGFRRETSIDILRGVDHKVKSLRRWIGIRKAPNVLKTIRAELDAGAYDKIVIFGVHKTVLEIMHDGLADYGSVLIYGGTPAAKRDRLVRRFQTEPRCRVFVGQVVAAGTAITLTAAHHVAMVEADWTPATNQQAVMRVHRIGQKHPVLCRFFGLAGSLDEQIQRVLRRKTKTLVELFDK